MPKKKFKEIRIYRSGNYPESRKERDKLYRFLERIGFMRQILTSHEIILREEVK